MSRRLMYGWSHIAIALSLFVAIFSSAPLFVQSINFSFPVFSSHDDFISLGETRHNPDTFSFTIKPNPSQLRLYSDQLVYTEKVRMKNRDSNAVASFSTSFTFSISQQEQSTERSGWLGHVCGFTFVIASEYNATMYAGHVDLGINYFGVEFDTYNSYGDEDPSDNHIGVNINNPKSAYTYNLCGGQRTSCSFPWTGRNYTAWISYNGSTQSLEIWCANGSMVDGDVKPKGSGLIKVPKVDLNDTFEEYMYIMFSGNPGPFSDTYEILSWNFTTCYFEQIRAPTFKLSVLIIGAACGTAVLIAIFLLQGYRTIGQPHSNKSSELELNLHMGLRRFSYKELKKATKNFNKSALLGKGGSGSVYKGILTGSDIVVAVKRLKHGSEHVERDFLAEVSTISQIRHRNLVQLLGWCHEGKHFMLVFYYMSNGNLDEWLFPSRRRHPHDPKYKKFEVLPWELRIFILAGVAAAVEYMHGEWVQCVLHRDIKSSNVMVDVDFNPHLGDFGLARLIDHKKLEKTTLMAGTLGYMAPEMHYTSKATKESDVYSFGILMLEVICGRKPINLQIEDPNNNFLLVQNVWRAYEGGNILSAIDLEVLALYSHQLKPSTNSMCNPELVTELSSNIYPMVTAGANFNVGDVEKTIVPLLHLGLHCCFSDPRSRPSMRVVKQAILQLQRSAARDTTTILNSMPPLSSTMPIYASIPQLPESFIKAMEVPLDDGQVSLLPRSDTISVLRRRFQ